MNGLVGVASMTLTCAFVTTWAPSMLHADSRRSTCSRITRSFVRSGDFLQEWHYPLQRRRVAASVFFSIAWLSFRWTYFRLVSYRHRLATEARAICSTRLAISKDM